MYSSDFYYGWGLSKKRVLKYIFWEDISEIVGDGG